MFSHLTALRETRRAIESTLSKWERTYGPQYLSVMGECITDGLYLSREHLKESRHETRTA